MDTVDPAGRVDLSHTGTEQRDALAGPELQELGVPPQFSFLAIPLTAALTLRVSPAQMALLGAAQFAPGLVFGLFIGVWLDRARRRPVMVLTQLASRWHWQPCRSLRWSGC